MAAMEPDSIRVTRSVLLPLAEVELRFSRSSGPGGQHANTAETRVEAILDVEASSALTDAQKRRVLAKAGPTLRAIAQDERSQWRNRELAVEEGLHPLAQRRRTEAGLALELTRGEGAAPGQVREQDMRRGLEPQLLELARQQLADELARDVDVEENAGARVRHCARS